MHARIVRMTYTGDRDDITRRAEEGLLPMFQGMSGFKAYSVAEADGEIISFSAWETREDAEAANAAVTKWVAENLAGEIEVIDARLGEILLSTTLGISTKAGAPA
jgi:heme-degrading monooxygenase HmoA